MVAYYKVPLLVWLVIWGSCAQEEARQRLEDQRVDGVRRKVEALAKTVSIKAPKSPFEWSRAEKKQFLERLKTLKEGNNLEEVVKLLGPPYSTYVTNPKETREPRGMYIDYFLKKVRENGPNERVNQYVFIHFDNDGKLINIMTNIKGLTVGELVKGNSGSAEIENLDEPNDH